MSRLLHPMPSAEWLDSIETISEGYTCDLKIDMGDVRYWLHRTSIEDGEPFVHTVTIEVRVDGCWYDALVYDGDDPEHEPSYIIAEEPSVLARFDELQGGT